MEALALKYRPKNYDELIGQETVSKSLKFALDNDKIAHAYLFSGLRGSGKTSSARIFAKCLNCEAGVSSHPCGKCESCLGNSLDIIEMDAASNRKLEDIQDLIEQTKYAPTTRYKIFIIDEVHMLTKEAFNALLKTLEEPPKYVKFILATTDPLKIPPTVLSRTQHFRFFKISSKKILSHLEYILKNENIPYDLEALKIITRSGGGSLRDTLTLLDQGIIYSGGNINSKAITSMLGLLDISKIDKFFNIILSKDKDLLLEFLENIKNYEISRVIDDMCAYLKDKFFEKDYRFDMLTLERFMGILARCKNMLSACDDEEFVLCVMSFMLQEAYQGTSVDDKISIVCDKNTIATKPQIDNFAEFKKMIFSRDYELGACLERCFAFVSLENGVLTLDANPNDDEKNLIKSKYKLLKQLSRELFDAELKIIATKLENQTENKIKQNDTENSIQNINPNNNTTMENINNEERKKQALQIVKNITQNSQNKNVNILNNTNLNNENQNNLNYSQNDSSFEEKFFNVLNTLEDFNPNVAEVFGEFIEFESFENGILNLLTTAEEKSTQEIIKANYQTFKEICANVFNMSKIVVKKKLA